MMTMPINTKGRQRKYGPPIDFVGIPPLRGSEVFIGGLPVDCFETELVPFLETVGPIFQMRLMINFDGTSRGFGFAQFYSPLDAERAVMELNNSELRRGRKINVLKSISKCTLYLKNLPKNKEEHEIRREIDRIADGVVMVSAPKNAAADRNFKNRGFAFVQFESHFSAVDFLTTLLPGDKLMLWEREVYVEWAKHMPDREAVIVFNLSPRTSIESLREIFNRVSQNSVVRVEKVVNTATVYFQTQGQAEMAKSAMNEKVVDGYRIQVKMNSLNWSVSRRTTNENVLPVETVRPESLSTASDIQHRAQQSINSCYQGQQGSVRGLPESAPSGLPDEISPSLPISEVSPTEIGNHQAQGSPIRDNFDYDETNGISAQTTTLQNEHGEAFPHQGHTGGVHTNVSGTRASAPPQLPDERNRSLPPSEVSPTGTGYNKDNFHKEVSDDYAAQNNAQQTERGKAFLHQAQTGYVFTNVNGMRESVPPQLPYGMNSSILTSEVSRTESRNNRDDFHYETDGISAQTTTHQNEHGEAFFHRGQTGAVYTNVDGMRASAPPEFPYGMNSSLPPSKVSPTGTGQMRNSFDYEDSDGITAKTNSQQNERREAFFHQGQDGEAFVNPISQSHGFTPEINCPMFNNSSNGFAETQYIPMPNLIPNNGVMTIQPPLIYYKTAEGMFVPLPVVLFPVPLINQSTPSVSMYQPPYNN